MKLRRANERGHAQHGWLESFHTFSFADYYDPAQMGFRSLRVLNDDRVAAKGGFPTHPHNNMEILSYVLSGGLEHRDSMGNGSVIRPGDVQRMTAGTGVLHSEKNHSNTESVHFLQIWIMPERRGLEPGYEQRAFPESERQGKLRLVASRDGREGSVTVHQDLSLYAGLFAAKEQTKFTLPAGRFAWVHVARGTLTLNGTELHEGDAASLEGPTTLELQGVENAEALVFDLA